MNFQTFLKFSKIQ